MRVFPGLAFAAVLFAQADSDLSRIAQSPYEIERWVNSHTAFNWTPLWEVLKADSAFLPSCEDPHPGGLRECGAEAITISQPPMVILLLRHNPSMMEEYLRFVPAGAHGWRLAGHFAPFVKYFPPTHRLQWAGGKPYLRVTGQGDAGTCLSSEVESWIDLTGPKMEPVFGYTVKGQRCAPGIPDREVTGSLASFEPGPEGRIEVFFTLRFTTPAPGVFPLGNHGETVHYVRTPCHGYRVEEDHSTISGKLLATLYDLDGDPAPEAYLQYDLEALRRIAAGPEGPEKRWLASFLRTCKPCPEKQLLARLLARPR